MVDSGTVSIPAVEAPSEHEADGDVATVCGFRAHGLEKLGKTNLEEHGKVVKRSLKRRRVSADMIANPTEKENLINALEKETCELFKYFNEVLVWELGAVDEKCGSVSSGIACMLEGSNLPFSRLANEIYEKLKPNETITLASVRRDGHFIGSRLSYGIDSGNTDFFEDESESSLWCWEVRDLKLLPKNKRKLSKDMRKGREKVRERIAALSDSSEMESKSNEKELLKELETNKRNIKKEMKKHDRDLQKEKSQNHVCQSLSIVVGPRRPFAKDKDLDYDFDSDEEWEEEEPGESLSDCDKDDEEEILEEDSKADDEDESDDSFLVPDGYLSEDEERELKLRQIKAEKKERRHEKEAAEAKKQLSIQKQASFMERFLKSKNSNDPENQIDKSPKHVPPSDYFGKNFNMMESTTAQMDSALSQQDSFNILDLQKSDLAAWHKMRHSSKSQHWGIRHKPKTKVFNKLKLQGSHCGHEASRTIKAPKSGNVCSEIKASGKAEFTMLMDEIEEHSKSNQSCQASHNYIASRSILLPRRATKLLQFDKSYRPAYYGSWSKKRQALLLVIVVGPRRPFAKDKDLDYDFDSDEEWEEEEPGESLSDCDKDDEEEILEEDSKADDEDESDDSFLVPDGYLSEDEGVHDDSMRTDCTSNEARISSGCMQEINNEEFVALLKHLSYLDNLTRQALRRDQPHIITNFLHEKCNQVPGKDLTGTAKIEDICLRMLCMVPYPGGTAIEEPFANQSEDSDVCYTQCKNSTAPGAVAAFISDSLLPEYVRCIQSNPNGMPKLVESLHQKFPDISKTQLRNKVRETCEFVNNRWQVKKEVLDKLGLSASPEPSPPADKSCRPKGIDTFFSPKRCSSPTSEVINLSNSSPKARPKPDASAGEDSNHGAQENLP
ncbi:hypothetical protein Taro_008566 [Colocasia esculenta]|uniref:Chromatin assembly factor 1 subunit A n=1 Tax=Colocasia esculenta TaxID=4460 RepID=A0A843TY03_COLES|nr:hypothetical protein [Colocasia esculenta]